MEHRRPRQKTRALFCPPTTRLTGLRLKSSTLRLLAGPDCKIEDGLAFLPSAGKDGALADLALLQEGLTRDQR
jgi:hypothetical protein